VLNEQRTKALEEVPPARQDLALFPKLLALELAEWHHSKLAQSCLPGRVDKKCKGFICVCLSSAEEGVHSTEQSICEFPNLSPSTKKELSVFVLAARILTAFHLFWQCKHLERKVMGQS